MQSTDATEKRADNRRDCSVRVTLQEDGQHAVPLAATAHNHSRAGVSIETARPLWPGMGFRIISEDASAPPEWAGATAVVCWCTVVRRPDRPAAYRAGLQIRLSQPPTPVPRRFKVLPGGAIQCPPSRPAAAVATGSGGAVEARMLRMAAAGIRAILPSSGRVVRQEG